MISKKRIAFDFDGVIHSYKSGWSGPENIPDPPVVGIKEVLKELSSEYEITIYSIRAGSQKGIYAIWIWLKKWCLDKYITAVTSTKPPAVCYVDDRTIPFNGDTTSLADDIRNFTNYLEKKGD